MQVYLTFINTDLIQIYTNLITILITQTQSVIMSHERIGGQQTRVRGLGLWVQETAWWASESTSCKEGSPEPGGQQGRQTAQSSRAELPVANGKREQHGVEQHLGVWSSAVSAAVWDLPQLHS